jgi:sugar lactone lactonase YvrE
MWHPIRRPSHAALTAISAVSLFSLAACGERKAEPGAAAAARDPNLPMFVANSGLATPESVLWDAARDVWYVSNINGNPTAKDDNGFIVRLSADGAKLDSLPFVNGADDDIVLNAPKGLALQGDTLWVADIDALRGFDVVSGMAVATVDLAPLKATFLNDVAIGPDGAIYITDSGIAFDAQGNTTHPGESRVLVVRRRVASAAVVLPRESAVNGIAWDGSRSAWMIVGFNSPNIFSWVPGAPKVSALGTGPGGGDGLIVLADGRAVYSSWADSSLTLFSDGKSTTLRKGLPAPADIGYDPARSMVAVPLFNDNRVEFWPLDATGAPPKP